jgi:hypothetical protein
MNVRRVVKWTLGVLLVLVVVGFLAFLYLIPPFTLMAPEAFSGPEIAAADAVKIDAITDPKTRALAERGKYIVVATGCVDCHAPPSAAGPDFARYMAGGLKTAVRGHGTFVSANLTADRQYGLGRRTDEDVLRVLRSGVSADWWPPALVPRHAVGLDGELDRRRSRGSADISASDPGDRSQNSAAEQ